MLVRSMRQELVIFATSRRVYSRVLAKKNCEEFAANPFGCLSHLTTGLMNTIIIHGNCDCYTHYLH